MIPKSINKDLVSELSWPLPEDLCVLRHLEYFLLWKINYCQLDLWVWFKVKVKKKRQIRRKIFALMKKMGITKRSPRLKIQKTKKKGLLCIIGNINEPGPEALVREHPRAKSVSCRLFALYSGSSYVVTGPVDIGCHVLKLLVCQSTHNGLD